MYNIMTNRIRALKFESTLEYLYSQALLSSLAGSADSAVILQDYNFAGSAESAVILQDYMLAVLSQQLYCRTSKLKIGTYQRTHKNR